MATVLFVHGTGVRQGSFLATYAAIQRAFDDYRIDHALEPCLWGDALGAAPIVRSLPNRTLTPAPGGSLTPDQDYARWELLYRDPRFELRLLRNRPASGPRPPGAGAAAGELWGRIRKYAPTDALLARLRSAAIEDRFTAASQTIVGDPLTESAVLASNEIGEPGQAVARALVAETLRLGFEEEWPILTATARDALVDQLVDDWQARVAGIGAFLLRVVGDMATALATPLLKHQRAGVSEAANPAAGDILRYQSRGGAIRDYIRASVEAIDDENVFLLAHSLGGIACVDLLAERRTPKVKGLVTVGSQAPYLHEIGALTGLEPGATTLPPHFPPWLNLYDPYDFLSYVAAPVLAGPVRDERIESGQPFPQSHGAYWTNPDTWAAIRPFLA
jgi:hypothetical protein